MDRDPLSPPENYPIPDMGSHHSENATYSSFGGRSVEEKREFLMVTRNTLELFSSILNSEDEPKPVKVVQLLYLHLPNSSDRVLVLYFIPVKSFLLRETCTCILALILNMLLS